MEDWFTPERADAAAGYLGLQARARCSSPLLILLGLVAGVVRTVARDFGFRLTRARGRPAAPARAVHSVRGGDSGPPHPGRADRERPDRARLGWYRLSFQTLGADQKEGGVQVAAPFARMEEIVPILAEAGFPRRRRARPFAARRAAPSSAGSRPGC